MLGSQNSGFFLNRPHTSLPTNLWWLAAMPCHFPSHNSPASHAVHKAIPCLGHWVPTALRRCGPMLGTRRWKGMRDFFAINFTYWDWMWKINSKLNGMFFRNSQTRAESAGFVGFSLYIYMYIYIQTVPCLFERVEGILRGMIEKLKA